LRHHLEGGEQTLRDTDERNGRKRHRRIDGLRRVPIFDDPALYRDESLELSDLGDERLARCEHFEAGT
jgi:hypothetical protein